MKGHLLSKLLDYCAVLSMIQMANEVAMPMVKPDIELLFAVSGVDDVHVHDKGFVKFKGRLILIFTFLKLQFLYTPSMYVI